MTTYKKLAATEADYELFPKAATPLILPSLVNSGRLTSAAASAGATNARKQIIIDEDLETHLPVTLTDEEREGGVYILGEPRKGKSTLMVSMAIQDINNGHGLLFIDPHYDAINNLLARIPKSRLEDVILLDPSDKNRSFALNVLHCPDPDDAIELDIAAGRVRDIFTKLWADERGELGICRRGSPGCAECPVSRRRSARSHYR